MRSKLIRIVALAFAALGAAGLAPAQSQTYPQKWFFPSDYGQWSIKSQQANSYQFYPGSVCLAPTPSSPNTFFPFNVNAPVLIIDATAANSEVVTPTAVSNTGSACSLTVAPTNQHYSFQLTSGTAGLQELLNQISSTNAYPALIWIDKNWYTLAASVPSTTPAAIIAAAKGNSATELVDNTTIPFTYYAWSGTKFQAVSGATGGAATPTVAATAGSGTSPTISDFGGSNPIVNLTPAATTATGSIFTLTYANTPASFGYAPVCTVQSIGTNTPAGTLSAASTFASSHATVTVSIATTALTAGTAYQFKVNCQ